jgi:hypothetical protein
MCNCGKSGIGRVPGGRMGSVEEDRVPTNQPVPTHKRNNEIYKLEPYRRILPPIGRGEENSISLIGVSMGFENK